MKGANRARCIQSVWMASALRLLHVFSEPVYSKPSHMVPIPAKGQWKSARWWSQVRGNWWEANGAKMAKTAVWVQQRCNRLNLVLIWLCIVENRKCDWLVQGMMSRCFCVWFYTVCIKLFFFFFLAKPVCTAASVGSRQQSQTVWYLLWGRQLFYVARWAKVKVAQLQVFLRHLFVAIKIFLFFFFFCIP